jgi:hypothetical protein
MGLLVIWTKGALKIVGKEIESRQFGPGISRYPRKRYFRLFLRENTQDIARDPGCFELFLKVGSEIESEMEPVGPVYRRHWQSLLGREKFLEQRHDIQPWSEAEIEE